MLRFERVWKSYPQAEGELHALRDVSVEVPDQEEPVRRVATTWLPRAEVRRVVTREEPSVVTSMEALSALVDGGVVRSSLSGLVEAYGTWIEAQRGIDPGTETRRETRDELMHNAEVCKERDEGPVRP